MQKVSVPSHGYRWNCDGKNKNGLNQVVLSYLLKAHDKRGVSATRLSEELEVTYKTAWLMLHKIRQAMRNRDAAYSLAGIVELDDAYFGAPSEGGKRGRGTDKTQVVVGLSLNKQCHPLFLKMEVVPDIKGKTLIDFAEKRIQPGSTISSVAYRSYRALDGAGIKHEYQVIMPKKAQIIYIGCILFFQMQRRLLVAPSTDLTPNIFNPI
jgi:transposase-like protein